MGQFESAAQPAAVLLVTGYVEHGTPAAVISICTVCLLGGVWFAVPLSRRSRP